MKPEANNLSLFKFKNSDIRVVQIDGEPWFVAAEVCRSIGLAPNRVNGSFQNHLRRLSQDETRTLKNPTAQNRRMTFVTESGLYKLVMRSDKPKAKEFQNWVTKVILPAIRKDGGYIHGEEHVVSGAMTEDELVFKAMEVMKRKVDRLSAEREENHGLHNRGPHVYPIAKGPSGLSRVVPTVYLNPVLASMPVFGPYPTHPSLPADSHQW